MRLNSLRLQNFRQHVDTRIEFRRGLTGIIGPNGAGKSTILEAIAWAIYGASAARGTNETIRFSRAPGRARVLVELSFALAGHEYRVNRSLNSADVFLDGGITPVATGIGPVSGYLESRLGMTRDEFVNTYFTEQKKLRFLGALGPRDRARFLAQVLGYERLKHAQDIARERRKQLFFEIQGVQEMLPDEQQVVAERAAAEARWKEARTTLTDTERRRQERERQLVAITPRWEDAQRKQKLVQEVGFQMRSAEEEGRAAHRDIERTRTELGKITQAEQELEPLRLALLELEPVTAECARLAEQARLNERRKVLLDTQKELATDVEASARRLKELESAPKLVEKLTDEHSLARQQLTASNELLARLQSEWAEERQAVRTKLDAHIDRHNELKLQVEQLREAGPEGTCPICTRPLGLEFDKVLGLLEEQFEEVKQNGKWLRQREKQLQKKPQDLLAAEDATVQLQQALDHVSARLARCEQAVQEAWTLAQEQHKKELRLKELTGELARIPAGYDPEVHAAREQRLAELREFARRASRLEQVLESRTAREREHAEATERAGAALAKLQEGAARLEEIAYNQHEYDELKLGAEQARTNLQAAEIALAEARLRVDNAKERLAEAKLAEKQAAQNRARLRELEIDRKHQEELEKAFQQLRQELNARVRPELSELASIFLNEITDGRYSALEIDENYNVVVLDEGEEKPVISGGEEDVADLVLRIAISQMIAERAGQQLSVLFLDEVFGSLDQDRRENVMQLLHGLENRFEQVFLITHVEDIREGLDHTIRVSFDERTGASVVTEEEVGLGELALAEEAGGRR